MRRGRDPIRHACCGRGRRRHQRRRHSFHMDHVASEGRGLNQEGDVGITCQRRGDVTFQFVSSVMITQ